MNTGRRDSAFTLIEILVALAMMAVIVGIVWASYAAATRSVTRCSASIYVEQEARAVFQRISREIRCCYVRPPEVEAASDEEGPPGLRGENNAPDGEILRMLTAGGIGRLDEASGGLGVVVYRFDESRHTLLRAQARLAETGDPLSDDARWWIVARDVQTVILKFFDGRAWYEEWDFSEKGELPRAVSIEIVFENDNAGRVAYKHTAWANRSAI